MHKLLLAAASLAAVLPAHAAVSVGAPAFAYTQSFDTLSTSTTASAWANDSTLAGWSLFNSTGAAAPTLVGGAGGSNAGSFYSFGSTGGSDRALGGAGSGNAYFGVPASGAIAGWMAVAFANHTGAALGGFSVGFDGEQWRNGGNTSAQTMVFEYGFGSSFGSVALWHTPGGNFDWASPVIGASAAAVDGNSTGLVAGRGGAVATPWAAGDTLWLRWVERNDVGGDHGLAIDNLSLSVSAVPEPESLALMLAGLAAVGFVARRRG